MESNYRLTNPILHYGILLLIFAAAVLTLLSHSLLHGGHHHDYGLSANAQPGAADRAANCSSGGKLYQVVIKMGRASPETTSAKLCDRLMFTNRDNNVSEIAFGPHEQHVAYDGVAAKILGHGQSFTITLNEPGIYHFHDHYHDKVSGYFNASK